MRSYPRQAVALIVLCSIFPILAFWTLCLRVRARKLSRKRLDASDYFLFVTMIIAVGNSITCIVGATNAGLGEKLDMLTPATEVAFMKILFATQFFYIFSVFTVKVAIVLFYKTMFVSTGFCKAANGLLVLLGFWIVAFFFVTLFQDKPISRNWGTVGKTVNFPVLYIVESVTDIALDLLILAMPLPVIRSLHISARKRWLLSGVFCLGAFCVIASTLRLYYMIKFQSEYQSQVQDFSQTVVSWIIWGAIEPCTSIMAACLPTLAPVLLPGRTSRHLRRQSYSTARGIRTETSVQVKNQAMDSTECFAFDVGLPTTAAGGFGTLTEVEGGRGHEMGEVPRALVRGDDRERVVGL